MSTAVSVTAGVFGRAPSTTPDSTDELRGGRLFNVVFFANFGKSLAHSGFLMGKRHDLIFSRTYFVKIVIER